MLSILNLNVAYGSTSVLRNVRLRLNDGEVLGLIGPNGAGKTSLIRAISGLLPFRSGAITINDQALEEFSESQRARKIAVVPQSAQLPPAFTVWESVALGRTPYLSWLGKLGKVDTAKVEWALEACEIKNLKDRRAGDLSGGEQQRVLLARALAQDCPILLMDEPTAHLDLHHQVMLLSLIARLARTQKIAVLVAMHDLNLASLYADRLVLLVEGEIRATGSPTEVLTSENLQAAYQVPLNILPAPKNGRPIVVLRPS